MAKNPVDEKLTRQVAQLARLELTDAEVTTFTAQLGDIVGYVAQLQELDVSRVEPMIHPGTQESERVTPLREDVVRPSPVDAHGKPRVLANAPEVLEDGFKVPPIL